jgi:sugar phosphate isomerase/epimerase
MPAFSTCWNNSRHHDGEAMVAEILELGFSDIELSHGMTIGKLPGIKRAFDNRMFNCVGVHNFFPSPVEVMIDAPDAYEFTSHREWDRKRAMDMTLKTLEVAASFNAQYLVLHMGSVPMNPKKWTKKLTTMVAEGLQRDPKCIKLRHTFVRKREKIGPLYLQRAAEALATIAEHAQKAGVKLAVESRSRFEDVPTETEMHELMRQFDGNPWVGYWHDFGHVQLKHNLGLLDHHQWIASIATRLIGGHVHDVEWPSRDHRVPYFGATIDYSAILPHFPDDAPLVWELSPTRDAGQIRKALQRWKQEFPDR